MYINNAFIQHSRQFFFFKHSFNGRFDLELIQFGEEQEIPRRSAWTDHFKLLVAEH